VSESIAAFIRRRSPLLLKDCVTEKPVSEMVAASEQPVLLGSGKTTQTLAVKARLAGCSLTASPDLAASYLNWRTSR